MTILRRNPECNFLTVARRLAGCLFSVGIIAQVDRLVDYGNPPKHTPSTIRWGRAAAGNSIAVWLLMVLALVPFLASYTNGDIAALLGIRSRTPQSFSLPPRAQTQSFGYSSIILLQPKKPHTVSLPAEFGTAGISKASHVIPFDGAYWYFKQPYTQPARDALVIKGDPAKKHIHSTDREPLVMEAHQPLGKDTAFSCCRSLRVDIINADSVAGLISIEVLLRSTNGLKTVALSLGTQPLSSSTISPMPLRRPAIDDKIVFRIPREADGRVFNEITVRIRPEDSRSLAGPQVVIKDFVLRP